MYLEVNLEDLSNQYALYSLTTQDGDLIHVGIVPMKQLTALSDLPEALRQQIVYLSIIKYDTDRLKLANIGTDWITQRGNDELRNRLINVINSWSNKSAGTNQVECIETGEIFSSAADAARQHDLTHGALLKHLKGEKSFNSVKGRTYRRVSQ